MGTESARWGTSREEREGGRKGSTGNEATSTERDRPRLLRLASLKACLPGSAISTSSNLSSSSHLRLLLLSVPPSIVLCSRLHDDASIDYRYLPRPFLPPVDASGPASRTVRESAAGRATRRRLRWDDPAAAAVGAAAPEKTRRLTRRGDVVGVHKIVASVLAPVPL